MKLMNLLLMIIALLIIPLMMASCVTTTLPDGTKETRYDAQAGNPFLELARDLFMPPPRASEVPVIEVTK